MATAPKLPIDLAPIPGFCVKSTTAAPATLPPPTRPDDSLILEPATPLVVPAGSKVFINICYDKNVPAPPVANEDAIQNAMNAQESNGEPYYVPVVVSQPRQDKDKAGSPALVFDCVYSSTLKSRTLRDSEFKIFLVELSLQRIEAQTSLVLSRKIGSPNILAKGKLEPRRVWVPAWLAVGEPEVSEEYDKGGVQAGSKSRKLIEEIDVPGDKRRSDKDDSASNTLPKLKGILKHGRSKASPVAAGAGSAPAVASNEASVEKSQKPTWIWKKGLGEKLNIVIDVSKETPYEVMTNSTLDIEPRRLILYIPGSVKTLPLDLDLDLSKSDAELIANTSRSLTATWSQGTEDDLEKETSNMLLLKRQRDFDVDTASAEWRVADGKLVVCV